MHDPLVDSPSFADPPPLRPGFSWTVPLPTGWVLLDTHSDRWRPATHTAPGSGLDSADALTRLGAAGHTAAATLTLLRSDTDPDGVPHGTMLTIAWTRVPLMTSMAQLRHVLHDATSEIELVATPSAHLIIRSVITPSGSTAIQAFRQLTGTTWLAVITATVTPVHTRPALRELAIHVADGIRRTSVSR